MEMLHHLIIRLVDSIESWGYARMYILMTLESTFVPIPSEIVMPPAGYLAYKGEKNIYIATLMGGPSAA